MTLFSYPIKTLALMVSCKHFLILSMKYTIDIIILYCVNCKFPILSAPPCGNHMLLPQCTVHCNTMY